MEDRKKLRKLQQLEGIILALKNQVDTLDEEFGKLIDSGEEYNYETATDKEKEVMKNIIDMVEYINNIWHLRF